MEAPCCIAQVVKAQRCQDTKDKVTVNVQTNVAAHSSTVDHKTATSSVCFLAKHVGKTLEAAFRKAQHGVASSGVTSSEGWHMRLLHRVHSSVRVLSSSGGGAGLAAPTLRPTQSMHCAVPENGGGCRSGGRCAAEKFGERHALFEPSPNR